MCINCFLNCLQANLAPQTACLPASKSLRLFGRLLTGGAPDQGRAFGHKGFWIHRGEGAGLAISLPSESIDIDVITLMKK